MQPKQNGPKKKQYFDIKPNTSSATSRPVIASSPVQADPMVSQVTAKPKHLPKSNPEIIPQNEPLPQETNSFDNLDSQAISNDENYQTSGEETVNDHQKLITILSIIIIILILAATALILLKFKIVKY